jgi:superfamily II DNA helicase RecQ
MPFRVFSLPATDDGTAAELLNQFLRRVQVVAIEKHLVTAPGLAHWSFCVEYLDGPAPAGNVADRQAGKVDYRAILSPEVFKVYAHLRSLRKTWAEQAGVPVYAVFTNSQLAAIAAQRPGDLVALRTIEGIGEAKATAFGHLVIEALAAMPGQPGT